MATSLLAVELSARAKAELQERQIANAELCGLPLSKVEELFGRKSITFWKSHSDYNAWTRIVAVDFEADPGNQSNSVVDCGILYRLESASEGDKQKMGEVTKTKTSP